MKRWLIVTLSIVGVLAVTAGGAYWWLTQPTEAVPYEAALDEKAATTNSAALSVMAASGIEDAYVDIASDRVVMAINADAAAGDPGKVESMMLIALAAAAGAADTTASKATILAVANDAVVLKWEADLASFRSMIDGGMTEAEYLASVVKTPA